MLPYPSLLVWSTLWMISFCSVCSLATIFSHVSLNTGFKGCISCLSIIVEVHPLAPEALCCVSQRPISLPQ